MFVCLPDVQDQISGYLIEIGHLWCSSNGMLAIIEQFCSITLEVLLLEAVDFDPVQEPCLNLPPCVAFILPGILTFCG